MQEFPISYIHTEWNLLFPTVLPQVHNVYSARKKKLSTSKPEHLNNFPMREYLGKHSCMSSSFPIAMLNGTLFFAKRHGRRRLSEINYDNNDYFVSFTSGLIRSYGDGG